MAEAYWIACYRSISNPGHSPNTLSLPAPPSSRSAPASSPAAAPQRPHEAGIDQRTVLIEFPSVAQAIAAHDSPGYQAALVALGDAAERDMRIVEGVDVAGLETYAGSESSSPRI